MDWKFVTSWTTSIPFPPPPCAALIRTGKPISDATTTACAGSIKAPSLPGTTGIFRFFAVVIAFDLLPILSILATRGPIKLKPCSRQILA